MGYEINIVFFVEFDVLWAQNSFYDVISASVQFSTARTREQILIKFYKWPYFNHLKTLKTFAWANLKFVDSYHMNKFRCFVRIDYNYFH